MNIPKIYTLGHRCNAGIFDGSVVVEEKIDGSQFSFMSCVASDGERLKCRSKGAVLSEDPGMFNHAVATAQKLFENGLLQDGWQYQCEYLAKPKHNVLNYACIPAGNLVLFDVRTPGGYLEPAVKREVAEKLGITPVPVLFEGRGTQLMPSDLSLFLERESTLGGCKIEGIVIKNYEKSHPESQSETAPMTAKYVSAAFKEKHAHGPINPKADRSAIAQVIVNQYRTEARWLKVVQHLKEAGRLVNGPEDIGPLMKELHEDLLAEEAEEIKQALFDAHWKEIARGVCQGFPEFYKKLLCGGPSVWQDMQINEKTSETKNS